MPARVILNADDFGLTLGVNRAIAELHRAGVLTSSTLMATGAAFDDAVALAHSLPTLGVGCHVVLVDGSPVSPPEEIRSLLGPDRRNFRSSLLHFVRDLLLGHIDKAEIAREALAQIQKLRRAGIEVTHIDTHKHTHLFPAVAKALLSLGAVSAIRNPFEPVFARDPAHASVERRIQIAILDCFKSSFQRVAMKTPRTDGTIGISATGNLNALTLRQILSVLPPEGTFELVCHPGYNDADLARIPTRLRAHREIECQALLAEIPRILTSRDAPLLIHYGNL